ncbi:MAG: hypothetical protein PHQ89_03855 [Bacilli bacterium]|nr:hypothetical protein [Bacilli bacterium]
MKKERTTLNAIINNDKRKIDLKVANKKYTFTFNHLDKKVPKIMNPVVLGVNDQSEVRIMVNTESFDTENDVETLVEQIKETFQDYMLNMKQGEFKSRCFQGILFKDEDMPHESVVQVEVCADHLKIIQDEPVKMNYQDISDIYIERKADLSNSSRQGKDHIMKYVVLYNNWIMIEANEHVFAFSGTNIELMFSTLSRAFFMSQMKKNK